MTIIYRGWRWVVVAFDGVYLTIQHGNEIRKITLQKAFKERA